MEKLIPILQSIGTIVLGVLIANQIQKAIDKTKISAPIQVNQP